MKQIGPYCVLEELPRASTGGVFLAERPKGGSCVVKVLDPRFRDFARFEGCLMLEAPAAKAFTHPHAAKTIDIGWYDRRALIVRELVEGVPLGQLIDRMAAQQALLPWELVAMLGVQIASVLSQAHLPPSGSNEGQLELGHGHLNCGRTFVTYYGHAKVLDVGLGRFRMCLPIPHRALAMRAPELLGVPQASPGVDVYGLGITLHAALIGQRVFETPDLTQTRQSVLHRSAGSVRKVRPEIPGALDALISEMVNKDPAERPAHFDDVGARFQALLDQPSAAYAEALGRLVIGYFPDGARAAAERGRRVPNRPPRRATSREPSTSRVTVDSGARAAGGLFRREHGAANKAFPPSGASSPAHEPEYGLAVGAIVEGRYQIIDQIGEGGASLVYRAEHNALRKQFALKILRPELNGEVESTQRFLREARSVCQLDHPNVVRVSDFGQTQDGLLFLVMELAPGQCLADLIWSKGTLPAVVALATAIEVLRGLGYAHDKGLIHRDLKPANIMVDLSQGKLRAKVLDFGIAKTIRGAPGHWTLTKPGQIFGTPHYMSPEQAEGMPVDLRADLYAVGVTLYEMLSGHSPFPGEQPMVVLSQVLMKEPLPLHFKPHPVVRTERVVEVVSRALQKDRNHRFESADQMITALENCLVLGPPNAHPASPPP